MSNHSFDIHVASEYKSVEIAILVWHFQYWIMKNKRLNRNLIEGRTWTYQTYEEIAAVFPYWSRDQVKRLLKKVIDSEILVKGNFNKTPFDKTVWYAFKDEEKFGISLFRKMDDLDEEDSSIGRNRPIDFPKSPDGKGEIARPIPDTLPNTLTNKDMSELPFGRIASSFFAKLKETNPKIKKPNLQKWAKEFELLAQDGDGSTADEIEKVITYVLSTRTKPSTNGFCWASVILSPASLRKNFAKIWAEMSNHSLVPKGDEKADRILAEKIWNRHKGRPQQDISLSAKYLEFIQGVNAPSTVLEFGSRDFRNNCLEQLRKRKLTTEGL